ncbi:MAG: hypothetical protein M1829_005356 [Trizodia sp. TS-e1964]|nr:MAG: hypothetical protein M1829_005356 [Trizodia sp. TS-e1964]
MSSALTNASPLKPEIQLAQAVSQFEADLASEQKSSFRASRAQARDSPPDPSDIMRLTAEIERRIAGRGRCFGPRFTSFLEACQQFAAIGDTIVGSTQSQIASGVWTVVRISLLMITKYTSYLEKLSSLLMATGRSAPRYQTMALLYPRSKILQSYMSEYYLVVVRLCHQLLNFTHKSILRQLASTLSDSEAKSYQSELDKWANLIKEEVNLLMAKEVKAFSSKFSKSVLLQKTIKTNLRLLNICSTYNYETTWKQTRKVGNATLFNQNAEYQDWKDREYSSTLIYTGKLGAGKSVLLANIVDDLHLHFQNKNTVVAYFFCRYDIPKSLKARTVIGSLAHQLLRTIPNLAISSGLFDETSPDLDLEEIIGLLQHAVPLNYKAYFILDGLDECDFAERQILIQKLRNLQEKFTLLVCVSFRLDPNNALNLGSGQFNVALHTSFPEDNPDIEAFIWAELNSCLKSNKLVIGDPALILEIQNTLQEKSQAMFLWVALQIESLCAMKTDHSIRQALADLPKDLSETFTRILRKSEGPYQRLILELIIAARRPLTAGELREALSVVPGDAVWNPAKLLNDIYSTLTCCGSLVTVDEEELTIRLMHHSVKQFLLNGFQNSTKQDFTADNAERKMANIIVTYLNYGVFETQLSTNVVPQMMIGSAPSRVIHSMLDSSNSIRGLALKLLNSRNRPDYDISKTLAESRKLLSHSLADEFHFYTYSRSHWLQHVFYISEQESVMLGLLLRLFKGMIAHTDISEEVGQKPLMWAASNGHEEIVKILLETGNFDIESKDFAEGQTPLSWASKNGHEAVVKLLLEKDAKIETIDKKDQTPLLWAAQNGHEKVVKLLLEKCAELEIKLDSQTPLLRAAQNGHEKVVKLLLEKGAELETKDKNFRTPLSWSARNWHVAIVKLLLEKGAQLEARDMSGLTTLSWAGSFGHVAIAKLLLEKGAELEAQDKSGLTPVSWALKNGHNAVVDLLLENGAKLDT